MRLRCALSQLSKQHEPHRPGCAPGNGNTFVLHAHLPPPAAGAASVGQPRPAGPFPPCRWVGRTARLGMAACACPVGLPPHWRLMLQACQRPAHHLGACLAALLAAQAYLASIACVLHQAGTCCFDGFLCFTASMQCSGVSCGSRRPALLQGCSRSLPGWRSCADSLSTPQTSRMCGL